MMYILGYVTKDIWLKAGNIHSKDAGTRSNLAKTTAEYERLKDKNLKKKYLMTLKPLFIVSQKIVYI